MDKRILEEKTTLLSTDYVPKYEQLYVHPEEGETFRFNDSMSNIISDIDFIDSFLVDKAQSLYDIMNSTVDRLNLIDLNIISEQERLQDIKMLCNKFTDFDNVIPLNNKEKVRGTFNLKDGVFSCQTTKQSNVAVKIYNITGNGIEGNKYIYKDFAYVKDSVDTSDRNNIIDDSKTSFWEYERISASPSEEYLLSDFNTDSENAICTINIYSEQMINMIDLTTDATNVSVVGVQYSYNGTDFDSLEIPNIQLNNKLASYDDYDYIYGDNKILIPFANYVKITFQSSGVTDDIIAYDRIMFEKPKADLTPEEKAEQDAADGIIGGYIGGSQQSSAPTYNLLTDETIVVKSAKRHLIKINDLKAYSKEYNPESHFTTTELINENKYYSAAVFANVYIPSELSSENVEFILTINGEDYKCIPINNKGNGLKVFRFSQGKSKSEYTQLLSSPITSLFLTVKIKGTKDYSPYINNIKILLGGKI